MRLSRAHSGDYLGRVWRLLILYSLGFLGPIVIYLIYFSAHGAAGALASGLFVKPFQRLTHASKRQLPLIAMLPRSLSRASWLQRPNSLSSVGAQ